MRRRVTPGLTRNRPGIPVELRFWDKVDTSGDCWLWTASLSPQGYGQIRLNGRPQGAHRVSFEMANGAIPAGFEIDHRCRNRRCVNPHHLRLATRAQNSENHIAHAGSRSGIRGVYAVSKTNGRPWRVAVTHDGVQHYGGCFWSLPEAEQAATALRLELHTHNEMDRS